MAQIESPLTLICGRTCPSVVVLTNRSSYNFRFPSKINLDQMTETSDYIEILVFYRCKISQRKTHIGGRRGLTAIEANRTAKINPEPYLNENKDSRLRST
jgi:hypothetical protein